MSARTIQLERRLDKKHDHSEVSRYFVPAEQNEIDDCLGKIIDSLAPHSITDSSLRFLLLDTYDWRLLRNDMRLQATEQNNNWLLELYSNRDGSLLASSPSADLPNALMNFPPGALANRLRKTVTHRALLPAIEFRIKQRSLRLSDSEDKVIANLHIETAKTRRPKARVWHSLPIWLELSPVRGYAKFAKRVARRITQHAGMRAIDLHPIDLAVEMLKIQPTAGTEKTCPDLNPTDPAAPSIARCLLLMLQSMERNEDGIKNRVDMECLHDFRIAIRRTRTVLRQLSAMLPNKVDDYRSKLAWLGELSGPARDIDVLLADTEKFPRSFTNVPASSLEPLKVLLRHQQDDLYARLIDALNSKEYKSFKTSWRRFLRNNERLLEKSDVQSTEIKQVADREIWRLYKHVVRQGKVITSDSPADRYHALRKSCKRLRYLMEFFQSLYKKKQLQTLVKELKNLQDNLGVHQDLEVQTGNLGIYKNELQAKSDSPADTIKAIDRICVRLEKHKRRLRNDFGARFSTFSNRKNTNRFKVLFKPKE